MTVVYGDNDPRMLLTIVRSTEDDTGDDDDDV